MHMAVLHLFDSKNVGVRVWSDKKPSYLRAHTQQCDSETVGFIFWSHFKVKFALQSDKR